MRFPSGRILTTLAALVTAICFAAAPADARSCRGGSCVKAAKAKRLTAPAGYRAMTDHRADRRYPRWRERTHVVWHGWTGTASTFHLDGVAYPGGSRRGPATAYNNYEGGFHPEAFWVLHQRNVSGQ